MNEYYEQRTATPNEPQPPNHLIWGILATIFCCLPLGIVSIVYAAQVNAKWQSGDFTGAKLASKNARMWALIALGAGIIVAGIFSLIAIFAGLSGLGLETLDTWN